MKRLCGSLVVAALLVLALQLDVDAIEGEHEAIAFGSSNSTVGTSNENPDPPPDNSGSSGAAEGLPGTKPINAPSDVTVRRTAEQVDAGLVADNSAMSSELIDPPGSDAAAAVAVVDATPGGPGCVEYVPGEYDPVQEITYSGFCRRWRACGAERVDDVASGRISGLESTGQYRVYLDLIGESVVDLIDTNQIPAQGPTPAEVDLQVGSISDVLLTKGLGESPGDDLLPVFSWCADYDIAGVFDPADAWDVTFGWDLTYADVYNIDEARSFLYAQVTADLDLYAPKVGLVPPVEKGFTYAQWPTWMFLQNPPESIHVFTNNDLDTLRVDLRATVLAVTWSFAGETIATCAPEDMIVYDSNEHDPVDDVPACHHIFTRVGYSDLVTTIEYKIEEQVRSRPSTTLHEYPAVDWSDYLGAETIVPLTTTLPRYEVHEILSLNIAPGRTAEEALANAKANGQIPELRNLDEYDE